MLKVFLMLGLIGRGVDEKGGGRETGEILEEGITQGQDHLHTVLGAVRTVNSIPPAKWSVGFII